VEEMMVTVESKSNQYIVAFFVNQSRFKSRVKPFTLAPFRMKYVALLSGGKDSCYNLLHCQKNGHELVAAASLRPEQGKGAQQKSDKSNQVLIPYRRN
jgi:hypothetical protein